MDRLGATRGANVKSADAKRLLDNLAAHDATQLHVALGIRTAWGIALALVVGTLTTSVAMGVVMAVGALVSGFAGLSGTVRQRLRTMALAVLWIGLASFFGSVVGHCLLGILLVTIISGFCAGIMVAVSPQASQIGTLATTGLVIFSGFPTAPYFAVIQTIFVVCGGILQILLMLMLSVLFPPMTEINSVIAVFEALADYVAHPTRQSDLTLSYAMAMAEGQVSDSFLRPSYQRYLWLLLRLAQKIRVLWVNHIFRQKKPPTRVDTETHADQGQIVQTLRQAASVLRQRAEDKRLNRPLFLNRTRCLTPPLLPDVSISTRRIWSEDAVQVSDLGQALSILSHLAQISSSQMRSLSTGVITASVHPVKQVMDILRANFTARSAAFRHALRMAVILGVAVGFSGVFALPRGYWVPLTTLVILKPDFFSTISRGLARVFGTLGGVVLATGLIALPIHMPGLSLLLVVVFAAALYAVIAYNYTLFSVFITAEIVVLLSFFDHLPPGATMRDRLLDTVLGTIFALMAYLLWPRWQRTSVLRVIGDLVHSYRLEFHYLIMRCQGGALTQEDMAFYRLQVQLSRTNAVSSLNHVLSRRDRRSVDVEAASGLLTALHRFGDALEVLQTYCVQKALWIPAQETEESSGGLVTFSLSLVKLLQEIENVLWGAAPEDLATKLVAEYFDQVTVQSERLNANEVDVVQALYAPIGTMIRMLPLSQHPHPAFPGFRRTIKGDD